MIKAGQIRELPVTKAKFVIEKIETNKTSDWDHDWVYLTFPEGFKYRIWRNTAEELHLVSEYPTVKEAMNSPEFIKDVNNVNGR